MKQDKLVSLLEAIFNTMVGFVLSVVSYWLLLPLFGIYVPFAANIILTIYFATLSVIRSFAIRRAFNAYIRREVQ